MELTNRRTIASRFWRRKSFPRARKENRAPADIAAGFLELTSDAVLLLDENQRIRSINRAAVGIFGYQADELIGQPLEILLPNRYRRAHDRHVSTFSASTSKTLRMDHRQNVIARHKHGREFTCGASIAKMDLDGKHYYLVIVHDLTHRQRVEDALRVQGQIIDQIHDAVVSTDLDGYVTSWNRGAEYLFGFRPKEALGRHISFVYEEHLHDFLEQQIIAPLKANGRHEVEVRMRKKSGELFDAHLALSLLQDSQDKVVGMIGYSMDITQRKRAERELKIRARQSAIVASLGQRALADESFETLMADIVRLLADTLRMDVCNILDLSQDQKTLKVKHSYGATSDPERQLPVSVYPDAMESMVLNSDTPVAIRNWSLEDRFGIPERLSEKSIASSIHLKIGSKGRRVGILEAGSSQEHEFRPDDIYFLHAVANVLSDAIERRRYEQALKESEEKFRTQYKNIPIPTYSFRKVGDDFILLDYNLAAESLSLNWLGWLTGSSASEIYKESPAVLEGIRRCHQNKSSVQHEMEHFSPVLGRTGIFQMNYVFIPPDRIMVHAEDITERKNAERHQRLLFAAEQRARKTAEKLRSATAELSSSLDQGHILEVLLFYLEEIVPFSRATVSFFQDERLVVAATRGDAMLGPEVGDEIPAMEQVRFHSIRDTQNTLTLPWKSAFPQDDAGGHQEPRSWMGLPIRFHDALKGYLELIGPVSEEFDTAQASLALALVNQAAAALENAHLFEQVRSNNRQIREMARELVTAQENERKRISRDLHDDAGQTLIALIIMLDIIRSDLPVNLASERERLAEAAEMAKGMMEKLRLLTHDLRPPELDSLGLNTVLENMCRTLERNTHLKIEYQGIELNQLAEIVKTSLYRLLQEALTNVAKHARATHVKVMMETRLDELVLSVTDNGRGFDPAALEATGKRGIGLAGIQERVELIGGHVEIKTRPGLGTRLTARIPLQEAR